MCVKLLVFVVLRCHIHSLHTSHGSRCPSVCLISSMHGVSVSSDFLDLFITFIFFLLFLINLKQLVLATLQLHRGYVVRSPVLTSPRRWGSTDESFSNTATEGNAGALCCLHSTGHRFRMFDALPGTHNPSRCPRNRGNLTPVRAQRLGVLRNH